MRNKNEIIIKKGDTNKNIQAKRFVDNLITPIGYWKNIYHTASVIRKPLLNDTPLNNGIAELLKTGKMLRTSEIEGSLSG